MANNITINLLELFEDTVANHSEKTALIDGDRTITFKDLDRRSDLLAIKIHDMVRTVNGPVAVLLPKCIEAVITDLAIMKSANIFMNLDVKTPAQRLHNITDLIEPVLIITDSKNSAVLQDLMGIVPVFIIDDVDWEEGVDKEDVRRLWRHVIDTDPFCIINTSGSTGTPKGVALNHLSFLDFIYRSHEAFNIGENEVMGSLSPIVFDIYVLELCLLMYRSTTLVLLPAHLSAFPVKLMDIMQQREVSFIFWVPTIMVNIANMGLLDKVPLPHLRLVWFAGEVFPTKQFNIWRKALPHVRFANLYGPIETAVDSIYYIIDREIPDDEPIPIGYAYRNTDIILLDDNNSKVTEVGVEGEICVRGSSLALGYYNNPVKTAAAFVQNPLNTHYPERIYRTGDIGVINERGEIVFKGRKDSLIKHQGYRIELCEVEHVIVNTLKLVRNGCVVYDYNKKDITMFYENDDEINISEFRRVLSKHLPRYMVPSKFIREDELIRNTNGKIDRLHYKNVVKD